MEGRAGSSAIRKDPCVPFPAVSTAAGVCRAEDERWAKREGGLSSSVS